jgi:hypothetical protein
MFKDIEVYIKLLIRLLAKPIWSNIKHQNFYIVVKLAKC